MEKSATIVASPRMRGEDPPGFDELLADGSFHARLAQARVERERALAQAAAAGETDLLLPHRKPWDSEESSSNPTPRQSRNAQAGDESFREPIILDRPVQAAESVTHRATEPPAKKPATPEPARRQNPPMPVERAPVSASSEHLADRTPVHRQTSRTVIAGGFAAGLLIGAMLSFIYMALSPSARENDFATDGWVAMASEMPPPSAVDEEISNAWRLPLDDPNTLLGLSVGHNASVRAAEPLVSGMVAPADVAPWVQGTVAPRPAIGGGLALLTAGALPDIAQIRTPEWDAPMVRLALPDRQVFPEVISGDLALAAQPAGPFAMAPETDDAIPVSVNQKGMFPHRIVLHTPVGVSDERLGETMRRLDAAGFILDDQRRTELPISQSNVRYFYAEDAKAAAILADSIGAVSRDFTSFSPLPENGMLEIWLAGRGAGRASSERHPPATAAQTASQIERDRHLLYLRSLILQQLHRDGHL